MKKTIALVSLLLTFFMGSLALANPPPYPIPPESTLPDQNILGFWRTEYPLAHDPRVYAWGEVDITEDSIWFRATCEYTPGPILTAEVQAPIRIMSYYFQILSDRYNENRQGPYGCHTQLRAQTMQFSFDYSGRLTLFNPANGWRLSLIR